MGIEPFFSLTPSSPMVITYDPANPSSPYAYANLSSNGGITLHFAPYSLRDQSTNDEIILGHNFVDPTDQEIDSIFDLHRSCTITIFFFGINVTTGNQYLLLFALRRIAGANVSAQFFVGFDLVHTQQLSGDELVAILFDTPVNAYGTFVYVRLASPDVWGRVGFQGVECYLL